MPGANLYDEVPYESAPVTSSHPDRLAVTATLFGLSPASATRCRVLELGCGTGGNLIPLALTLPESRFVGIDLSARQVETGQRISAALNLTNIDLRPLSLMDVDADFGEFDYIICHGVYSWVPAPVQDKILEICERHLAPQGVAYISYNTYPGWHQRGIVRDLMAFHDQPATTPEERVRQARGVLDFLAQSVVEHEGVYAHTIRQLAEWLKDQPDFYLLHEFLEDENSPVYFHEFARRAAARGLQYLSEPSFDSLAATSVSAEAAAVLAPLAQDAVRLEQYLDFLCQRTFRRTMLCRAGQSVNRAIPADQLLAKSMRVASAAEPVSESLDLVGDTVEEFQLNYGRRMSTDHRLMKAALVALHQAWPRALSLPEIWERAQQRLTDLGAPWEDAAQGPRSLAGGLLKCAGAGQVELYLHAPAFSLTPGPRPVANPLARLQAAGQGKLTTLAHKSADVTPLERRLVAALDGQNDRAALAGMLLDSVQRGELTVRDGDQPMVDPARLSETIDAVLDESLRRLAGCALLLA